MYCMLVVISIPGAKSVGGSNRIICMFQLTTTEQYKIYNRLAGRVKLLLVLVSTVILDFEFRQDP
jgi:hypothetical protein